MLKQKVQKIIEDKSLFTQKDKVIVALSGGADSVALLRILLVLGYQCECAHCNFHLRAEESNRDESFVRSLCQSKNVPLHVIHFDTETYAKAHHISIEMAARELRYEWFELLRKERNASVIAVAHHKDDNVETFLLNLIRGTGINGLKGIAAKNGNIVRPLLEVNRKDIIDYLEYIQQDFVTDSTNLKDEYTRNKIRLHILPEMQSINPSIADSINETIMRLSEVANVYNQDRKEVIQQKLKKISNHQYRISISDILNDTAPISLLHEILAPWGFNSTHEKDIYQSILNGQSGKRFATPEWEVLRDRNELFIQYKGIQEEVPELILTEMKMSPSFEIPKDKTIACVDLDRITLPLSIRKWEVGDKFVPFGMKGKKKVSDYLTDRKFSLFEKENQYVVCSGENIVWLVNERSDNRFRITENTQNILMIQIKGRL